jgi:hypothetical protein
MSVVSECTSNLINSLWHLPLSEGHDMGDHVTVELFRSQQWNAEPSNDNVISPACIRACPSAASAAIKTRIRWNPFNYPLTTDVLH